jgi:hypothetical protein
MQRKREREREREREKERRAKEFWETNAKQHTSAASPCCLKFIGTLPHQLLHVGKLSKTFFLSFFPSCSDACRPLLTDDGL